MQFQYITQNEELDNCVVELEKLNSLAVDLEFDKNRHAYGFNLCLVQIYTGTICYLIDPLGDGINIKSLFPIFENNSIQKVVFAFGEDLRLLHSLGCFPKNLFEISTAAKLLNYPPGSLATLLDTLLNVQISKSSQNSNWLKRPLTENQLSYAAQDAVHLLNLKEAICKEAFNKRITDWIEQENTSLEKLSYAGIENNQFIKKKDQNGLTEFEWYLYKELLLFRELLAEKTGKPSYQVYNKELLKEVALDPKIVKNWSSKKGNYRAFKSNRFQNQLKKIIDAANKLNLSKILPAAKPLSKEESMRYRRERSVAEEVKRKSFKPIQMEIAETFGEHAATIILGNRIVAAIISGDLTLVKDYQEDLILSHAKHLNIDLSTFFPTEN